jgi:hypothetical protein
MHEVCLDKERIEPDTESTAMVFTPLEVIELDRRVGREVEGIPNKVCSQYRVPKACLVDVPKYYMKAQTTAHEVIIRSAAWQIPKEVIGE